MCSHGAFQLIEKLWIDGIDRINQRRHGGARRGTEESAYGILRASALHFLWSDPRAIDERLAVAFALDQSLAAQSIDDLRDRRIHQPLWFTQQPMHVANGSRTEFPELGENDVFQFICR